MRPIGFTVTVVGTILCGMAPVVTPYGSRASPTRASKIKRKSQARRRNSSNLRSDADATRPLIDYTGELPTGRSDFAVTHAMVLAALRSAELPLSAARASVLPAGTLAVRQTCLGLVGTRRPSVAAPAAPRLTALLAAYLEGPDGPGEEIWRDFCYTSIQCNSNYAAKEHVDFNNLGPSLMVALGNFTGDTTGRLHYRGVPHVVKESWLEFDGREPHSVEAFGADRERYSIVFFCNGAYRKAASRELEALDALGLRVRPLLHQQEEKRRATAARFPSPIEARRRLDGDTATSEGRVLLVRGLAKGCQTSASRSDLASFGDQVTRYLSTCLERNCIGTVPTDGALDAALPFFEIRLHSKGSEARVRAANTCFVVAPSRRDAEKAADALRCVSDHRLVVEVYRPPTVGVPARCASTSDALPHRG